MTGTHPAQGTSTAQEAIAATMTEDELIENVKDLAKKLGYRCYHTRDSRGSDAGFPDLVLLSVNRGRLLFVELKTQRGKLTVDQMTWLGDLQVIGSEPAATSDVRTCVWRPSDWLSGAIEAVLR